MTSAAPIIWLFLHTRRGGVMIESTRDLCAPLYFVERGPQVYLRIRESHGKVPTATYEEEGRR